MTDPLSDTELAEIEQIAADLATLAGAQIEASLGRSLSVRYKSGQGGAESLQDPVSEVDHAVEEVIRERVGKRFADHDIMGEESEARPGLGHDVVWAIDPVDGTTNFVNGFPLFAASIGVLHRGKPVAGAIWCSTSHALRRGVYHARAGGDLRFDSEPLGRTANPQVRRRLVGLGAVRPEKDTPWDLRKTGSAALECAFVAAGLLEAARFETPNVWDVAAGIALVQAAGGDVRVKGRDGWRPFAGFADPDAAEGEVIRGWKHAVALGAPDSLDALCGIVPE